MVYSYKIYRFFLFLLVVCLLSLVLDGCGFRLRGSLGSAAALPAIYLEGMPGSAIMVELNETLHSIGTEVVGDRALAVYVLKIINEQQNRRILSVSSAGKVQEYELYYNVMFGVSDPQGNILLDDQKISLTRGFSFAETDVLAKGSEQESLIEGMRQEAVQGIIRRLQALSPRVAEPES
jgi:LPS-assembly lipoprotein